MRDDISHRTGVRVDLCIADLTSQWQIRTLSEVIHERYDGLDILINNAGGFQNEFVSTADGIGTIFAVNHLAVFFLTRMLYDLIRKNGGIITTSSMIHAQHIDFDNLQGEKRYDPQEAYARSKLCNVLFTYKLAAMLDRFRISVNCFHPGIIDTKLLRKSWGGDGVPVRCIVPCHERRVP